MTFLAPIDSPCFNVSSVEHMFNNLPGDLTQLIRNQFVPDTFFSAGLGVRKKVTTIDGLEFYFVFSIGKAERSNES